MLSIILKAQRILALSDTHGQHRSLVIPQADIIIYAGDACEGGDEGQLEDFFSWFSALPIPYKIFVAGNHDLAFDLDPARAKAMIPDNVIFLENRGMVIENIHFYGIVARPWMHVPLPVLDKVDVLITHGPAFGILDEDSGCPILRDLIEDVKPEVHLFGHIHSCGGDSEIHSGTSYYNVVSCLDI